MTYQNNDPANRSDRQQTQPAACCSQTDCCTPERQATCCAPAEKAACCGPAAAPKGGCCC